MSQPVRTSRISRLAPVALLGAVLLAGCGTDSTSQNDIPTTLSVPSATIAPPEDTAPMTDPSVPTTVGTTSSPATDPVTSDSEEPADTTSPGSAPVTAPPAAGLTPTQQALADVAIADVVDRRGVTTAEVAVISVDEVTWSDRSLGCPQRDMQYQQVLTPGIRVILDAAGQRAFYHGTSIDDLAYCATPTAPIDG